VATFSPFKDGHLGLAFSLGALLVLQEFLFISKSTTGCLLAEYRRVIEDEKKEDKSLTANYVSWHGGRHCKKAAW
jgi:hypothetical protein